MKSLRDHRFAACLAIAAAVAWSAAVLSAQGGPPRSKTESADWPLLALCRFDNGYLNGELDVPSVRFAIWGDGRVVYAKDPTKWGHDLRRGKISPSRVARLKAALTDTGVFNLKRTSYLVPDAPSDCLMVDLGGKQQMLYWDEVETLGYGINIAPKPQDLEFKRCWKALNHLALVALPDEREVVKERFRVPQSWYLKRAALSE